MKIFLYEKCIRANDEKLENFLKQKFFYMKNRKKSKRITSISGKKCVLVCNKCNSDKKNMQEEKKVIQLNKHGFVF